MKLWEMEEGREYHRKSYIGTRYRRYLNWAQYLDRNCWVIIDDIFAEREELVEFKKELKFKDIKVGDFLINENDLRCEVLAVRESLVVWFMGSTIAVNRTEGEIKNWEIQYHHQHLSISPTRQ